MIRFLGLIFIIACVSCGGILPGKPVARKPAGTITPPPYDQRLYLSILEEKYRAEKKDLNLTIVRSMIMEMESKFPELQVPARKDPVQEIIRRPQFKGLELTIEHLSHRESVKMHKRHSAFHAVP